MLQLARRAWLAQSELRSDAQAGGLCHWRRASGRVVSTNMDFFEELRSKFPNLVSAEHPPQTAHDQVSIALLGPDVRPLAYHLYSVYNSRLVAVFAEDRVAPE